ncbi:hypothetical protein, partial [Streptomyces sp. YS-3]|uniref:hypothetical protein n=1 Tax=Streptomyces sp. YS-3 TaxID=3381352 RepID=UPI00386245B0
DPDVPLVKEAAGAGDWAGVRALLESRPEGEDRIDLLWAVADTAGVEKWIGKAAEAEPQSALPLLVAGSRQISWAWEARTSARAQHVSREQFEVFHDRLRTAEKMLYEVAEREPGWTSPWYGLLVTGRGLQVGEPAARRRFEAAVRRDPYHLGVHRQRLQQVCHKWGSSHEEMHAFARRAALAAPEGSLLGELVALAHLEHWLDLEDGEDTAYLRNPEVRTSLRDAAERSVLHPDFVPRLGSVQVNNSFAMAFSLVGDTASARACFEATGGYVTESPWHYLNHVDPTVPYRKYRAAAGA